MTPNGELPMAYGRAEMSEAEVLGSFPFPDAQNLLRRFQHLQLTQEGIILPGADEKIAETGGEELRKFFQETHFRDGNVGPIILKACSKTGMVLPEVQRFWGLINGLSGEDLERSLPLSRLQSAALFMLRPTDGSPRIAKIRNLMYIHPAPNDRFFVEPMSAYHTTAEGEIALLHSPIQGLKKEGVIYRSSDTSAQLTI